MNIIPSGTKVWHRTREDVYAIILDAFYSNNDSNLYYHVDVYSKKTNAVTYHKGNWLAGNCIPIRYQNNIQAKKLLERDY